MCSSDLVGFFVMVGQRVLVRVKGIIEGVGVIVRTAVMRWVIDDSISRVVSTEKVLQEVKNIEKMKIRLNREEARSILTRKETTKGRPQIILVKHLLQNIIRSFSSANQFC